MDESAGRVCAGLVSTEWADIFNNGVRRRCFVAVLVSVAMIGGALVGCGGSSAGKSSGNPPSTATAPTGLTYATNTLSATVGVPITADTASVSGSSPTFSVVPVLPAGLTLDAATGTVSGTPTMAAASANYIVTATNSAGSTTNSLMITVAVAPPANLTYAVPVVTDTVGTPMQPDMPTVVGTIASFSIDPALPAGLAIDPSSGIISGTPLSFSPAIAYIVTAENSSGSTTAQLTIAVNANQAVLLEQGHGTSILAVRATANNVLSVDTSGHWVLWGYASGSIVTSGDGAVAFGPLNSPVMNQIDLAGQVAVVGMAQQLQIYSVTDGHQVFSVPAPSWWKLATDGSYLCAGTATSLTVWSSSGEQVFSLSGDYHAAIAYAAPGQIQLAGGPSGANVIETDSLPSGKSVISAQFSGTFNSWFIDGNRFLTNVGNTVWVYSNAAVQQELVMLPSIVQLTGQGNWFWSATSPDHWNAIDIYAVGGSTTPVQEVFDGDVSLFSASGNNLGAIVSGFPRLSVIDLSGSTPVRTDFSTSPISDLTSFAAASASQWIVGNSNGVLVDGVSVSSTPRYFGYGQVYGIAGSSNLAAVSTAIGKVLVFNPATAMQTESIGFQAGNLALSTDGRVLAAASEFLPGQASQLNLYSPPSTAPAQSFLYAQQFFSGFSLSGSGTFLGQVTQVDQSKITPYDRTVTNLENGSVIWSDSILGSSTPPLLSPDGTLIAADVTGSGTAASYVTNLYNNGVLTTATPGAGQGWLDNGHLLVANLTDDPKLGPVVSGFSIVDPTGAVVSTVPLTTPNAFACVQKNPNAVCLQLPTPNTAYDPSTNSIFSLPSGQLLWQVPVQATQNPRNSLDNVNTEIGAVAGSMVVFATGHQVVAVPGP